MKYVVVVIDLVGVFVRRLTDYGVVCVAFFAGANVEFDAEQLGESIAVDE
jgi:hypothetical protein